MRINSIKIFLYSVNLFLTIPVFAQYPKTAIWQWQGAPAWWYAQHDLAVTRIHDKGFIDAAKAINPDIIWLPTQDFNTAYDFYPNFPDVWYLTDSKGKKVGIHYAPDAYYADLSDISPKINGQRFIDAYADYLIDLVNRSGSAGISTDGLFYKGHLSWNMWSDVDLDRNGVNDLDEHGKSWVIARWAAGVDELIDKLRNGLGNKIFIVNSGSSDTPGRGQTNGYIHEYGGNVSNWSWELNYWQGVQNRSRKPFVPLQQSNPDQRDPNYKRPSKNMLAFVRFSLVKAMLLDRYYSFEHVDGKAPDHYWNNYFDEFDLNVGMPTSPPYEVRGVWLRFFDRGVAMANFSGSPVEVSMNDLQQFTESAAQYWHFTGNQDMALNGDNAMNNGQPFSRVTLNGYKYKGYHDAEYISGDGVILVTQPQAVVADIIIDNAESGTSPAQNPPKLQGLQEQDRKAGSGYYSLRPAGVYSDAVFASGSGKAFYTLNLGVNGRYDLYAWHPDNMELIVHGSQYKSDVSGRWDLIGRFDFRDGDVIETINIADALRLVYAGGDMAKIPPSKPRGVDVEGVR